MLVVANFSYSPLEVTVIFDLFFICRNLLSMYSWCMFCPCEKTNIPLFMEISRILKAFCIFGHRFFVDDRRCRFFGAKHKIYLNQLVCQRSKTRIEQTDKLGIYIIRIDLKSTQAKNGLHRDDP